MELDPRITQDGSRVETVDKTICGSFWKPPFATLRISKLASSRPHFDGSEICLDSMVLGFPVRWVAICVLQATAFYLQLS
jgi:hypothetical protein